MQLLKEQKLPAEAYLKLQGRFAHLFKPDNQWMIQEVRKEADRDWEDLLILRELHAACPEEKGPAPPMAGPVFCSVFPIMLFW